MNPYNYENGISEVKLSLKEDTPKLLHYEIQFRSALDTGYPENSVVKGEYYRPRVERKTPLAILVHGMGDHSVIPCKLLARSLLKQGIACFHSLSDYPFEAYSESYSRSPTISYS